MSDADIYVKGRQLAIDVIDSELDEEFCKRDDALSTAYEMMRIVKGLDDSMVVETAEAECEALHIRDQALDRIVESVNRIKALTALAQRFEVEIDMMKGGAE